MATQVELEIAALRARRTPRWNLSAWLRRHRPFDRRTIRDPGERDAYWATMQRRLAESDAAFILAQAATERPPGTTEPAAAVDLAKERPPSARCERGS